MATRLNYALPIARQLLLSASRRLRSGRLPATIAAPSQGKPLIIVTGAGRSGTSAVARVLHESGVRMGSDFDQPTEFNPVGYYQERRLYLTHDQMLAELGIAGPKWSHRWPWRSTVLAVAAHYREQMEALARSVTDGWKDPIFSVTLEAWLPLLPARPKLVVCLRSPQAFADSVTRIFGLVDREKLERQWASHYRRLLDVIRDYELEAMCVEYDALVEHPRETVAALAEFVGHPLKPEYVDPPLRHFARTVPEEYTPLYQEVRALSGSGSSKLAAVADGAETAPGQDDSALPEPVGDERVQLIDAYVQRVNDIVMQTLASKAVWTVQIGLPRPKLTQFAQLGLTLSEAMEQTRAASAVHVAVLSDAQETLSSLEPPPHFKHYHELTQREVNLERVVAQLLLAAAQGEAPDQQMLMTAIRAWRRFGRGSAVEKAQERRQQEHTRALKASGYLADRGVAPVP